MANLAVRLAKLTSRTPFDRNGDGEQKVCEDQAQGLFSSTSWKPVAPAKSGIAPELVAPAFGGQMALSSLFQALIQVNPRV